MSETLINFKTEKEDFHIFELVDGSIVKAKFVLVNLSTKIEPGKGEILGFQSNNVTGAWTPTDKRGPPGGPSTMEDYESNIMEENIMLKQIQDGGKNIYSYENKKIIVNYIIKRIDKTSLCDSVGIPIYLVRADTEIIVADNEDKVKK